jgi:hypothetical protein
MTALPAGLKVGETLYVDSTFIKQYPFRDIPKILHLPFGDSIRRLVLERLQNGY